MSELYIWSSQKDGYYTNKAYPNAIGYKVDEIDLADLNTHFTCGFCYHLAIWLHKLTKYPVYNVYDNHAVVGDGDNFLDITGWSTREKLEQNWKPVMMKDAIWKIDPSDFDFEFEQWGDWIEDGEELSPMRMRKIAKRILETYGATPPLTKTQKTDTLLGVVEY